MALATHVKRVSIPLAIPLAMSVLIFVALLMVDRILIGRGLLDEGHPTLSMPFLFRSFLLLLSALLAVVPLAQSSPHDDVIDSPLPSVLVHGLTWGVIAISAYFVLLLLTVPEAFYLWAQEDAFIENASAVLCVAAAALFLGAAGLLAGRSRSHRLLYAIICGLFTCVFLLIALEEVSYGQRLLGLETGERFEGNLQAETNLHNFYTNEAENLYYFGSFLFLVLIPFVYERSRFFRGWSLSFFIPSRLVLATGAVAVAYNYDMWEIPFIQWSFFVTVAILGVYLVESFREPTSSRYDQVGFSALLALVLASQAVFLTSGDRFSRLWDITEYKELLIPLSFFLYSVEIVRKSYERRE